MNIDDKQIIRLIYASINLIHENERLRRRAKAGKLVLDSEGDLAVFIEKCGRGYSN